MWKRWILSLIADFVADTIREYVESIKKVTRRNDTKLMLKRMRIWLEGSSNRTKRFVGSLIPYFETEPD